MLPSYCFSALRATMTEECRTRGRTLCLTAEGWNVCGSTRPRIVRSFELGGENYKGVKKIELRARGRNKSEWKGSAMACLATDFHRRESPVGSFFGRPSHEPVTTVLVVGFELFGLGCRRPSKTEGQHCGGRRRRDCLQ